ncbi:MAG: LD-carboxypeptidase [Proteobacteria bacterium]|nr:LD-carboxypeptidase [Pseudomonadota bacterium]
MSRAGETRPRGGLLPARPLSPGARIGLAAPAGPVDETRLAEGEAQLRALGYEVRRRSDLTERSGYLAGSDERRAQELMDLVRDPDVGAIVCVRGGYGCHRIVSLLDPDAFRAARKPLVGYSDVTTLLLWQQRVAGVVGFHGPMLEREGGIPRRWAEAVTGLLAGADSPPTLSGRPGVAGTAEGGLVGGSLSLVGASLGTPWEVETEGAILMLEDVDELTFRVDRLLQQLVAAGKLAGVAGVGLGSFHRCGDPRLPVPSVEDVLREALGSLGVPVVFDLPFGHGEPNLPWPSGGRARIDGRGGVIELLESGVSDDPAESSTENRKQGVATV